MKISTFILLCFLALTMWHCGPSGTDATIEDAKDVEGAQGSRTLVVDTTASIINWTGSKVTGSHNGTLKLSEGTLQLDGDSLVGGEFIMDMTTITVTDLEGEDKQKLEGHLKTGDFFTVDSFPTASFQITNVMAAQSDSATHMIEGNLTIKDIPKSVTFPATVQVGNGQVTATAKSILIDRTQWGITYKGMADNAISNDIALDINLVATEPPAGGEGEGGGEPEM